MYVQHLGAGTNCANKLHCGQEGKPRQHYVYTATIHVLWRSLLLDDKVIRSVPHWICGTLNLIPCSSWPVISVVPPQKPLTFMDGGNPFWLNCVV